LFPYKAGDGHVVASHEIIGNGILVPDFENKLSTLFVGNCKLEDFFPLGVAGTALRRCLVLGVLQRDDYIGVRLSERFDVGKVTGFNNAHVETTHGKTQ
jgi:hypothetical protein